jgi:hypothetical protein
METTKSKGTQPEKFTLFYLWLGAKGGGNYVLYYKHAEYCWVNRK